MLSKVDTKYHYWNDQRIIRNYKIYNVKFYLSYRNSTKRTINEHKNNIFCTNRKNRNRIGEGRGSGRGRSSGRFN